jgi:hypothetical protein
MAQSDNSDPLKEVPVFMASRGRTCQMHKRQPSNIHTNDHHQTFNATTSTGKNEKRKIKTADTGYRKKSNALHNYWEDLVFG